MKEREISTLKYCFFFCFGTCFVFRDLARKMQLCGNSQLKLLLTEKGLCIYLRF